MPAPPPPKLSVSLGALPVVEVALHAGRLLVGSDPSVDLLLPLPQVAARHAELELAGRRVTLRALAGEPIWVNGQMVESALLGPYDAVLVGPYTLRVGFGSAAAPPRDTTIDDSDALPARGTGGTVAWVRVVSGSDAGAAVPFEKQTLIVGRAPGNDLELHDPRVSWHHVALERTPAGIRVCDLNSRNGTFLDGREIVAAVARPGARLVIGETTIALEGVPATGSAAIAAGFGGLTGGSPAMQPVYARLREAASSRLPVLIVGETGTGKELAAEALHTAGPLARGPYVVLNCAAIPAGLIEDELFGHTRGAFTGATAERPGAFERADGGTLFLDEIGELPETQQPKLLRVLQDGAITRLGDTHERRVEFRLIAATNRDLTADARAGRFRQDLYYRVAALTVRLPPLRARLDDLRPLVAALVAESAREAGKEPPRVDAGALRALSNHTWPGNVRELRYLLYRAVLQAASGTIDATLVEHLLNEACPGDRTGTTLEAIEREAIRNALIDCLGSRRRAARRLGIAESTLYEKINRYGLRDAR